MLSAVISIPKVLSMAATILMYVNESHSGKSPCTAASSIASIFNSSLRMLLTCSVKLNGYSLFRDQSLTVKPVQQPDERLKIHAQFLSNLKNRLVSFKGIHERRDIPARFRILAPIRP